MARRRNSLANLLSGNSFSNYGEVPTIAVGDSAFTPSVFSYTPLELKPQDYSILQRSMALQEQRERDAQEQFEKFNERLASAKAQLYDSPDNQQFIANRQEELFNPVNQALALGDYASAIQEASAAGAKLANDSELIARLKRSKEYEDWEKDLHSRFLSGKISKNTENYAKKHNPFTFNAKYDENGNFVESSEYEPDTQIYDDLNIPALAMSAFKTITAKKGSTSRDGSTTVHNNTSEPLSRGGKSYAAGEAISSSGHSSNQWEKISVEDIRANMEEMIALTPDGARQVEQAYNVAYDDYTNLVKEYEAAAEKDANSEETKRLAQQVDTRKKLFYRNGSLVDYKEYYARSITDSLFAENLAYDWKFTASGGSSSYSLSDTSNTGHGGRLVSDRYIPGYEYDQTSGKWYSPYVRMERNGLDSQQQVVDSSNSIDNRFENK